MEWSNFGFTASSILVISFCFLFFFPNENIKKISKISKLSPCTWKLKKIPSTLVLWLEQILIYEVLLVLKHIFSPVHSCELIFYGSIAKSYDWEVKELPTCAPKWWWIFSWRGSCLHTGVDLTENQYLWHNKDSKDLLGFKKCRFFEGMEM